MSSKDDHILSHFHDIPASPVTTKVCLVTDDDAPKLQEFRLRLSGKFRDPIGVAAEVGGADYALRFSPFGLLELCDVCMQKRAW